MPPFWPQHFIQWTLLKYRWLIHEHSSLTATRYNITHVLLATLFCIIECRAPSRCIHESRPSVSTFQSSVFIRDELKLQWSFLYKRRRHLPTRWRFSAWWIHINIPRFCMGNVFYYLISWVYKKLRRNFWSPLMKTLDWNVETLGLEYTSRKLSN